MVSTGRLEKVSTIGSTAMSTDIMDGHIRSGTVPRYVRAVQCSCFFTGGTFGDLPFRRG